MERVRFGRPLSLGFALFPRPGALFFLHPHRRPPKVYPGAQNPVGAPAFFPKRRGPFFFRPPGSRFGGAPPPPFFPPRRGSPKFPPPTTLFCPSHRCCRLFFPPALLGFIFFPPVFPGGLLGAPGPCGPGKRGPSEFPGPGPGGGVFGRPPTFWGPAGSFPGGPGSPFLFLLVRSGASARGNGPGPPLKKTPARGKTIILFFPFF